MFTIHKNSLKSLNMASIPNNTQWRSFFDKWAQSPEIWNSKSVEYKNRHIRNKAWLKLLKYYQQIDPDATVGILKHKLHNIKGCYRRELRKVDTSMFLDPENIHVPMLWYFEKLHFLRCDVNEQQIAKIEYDGNDSDFEETQDISISSINFVPPEKQRKIQFSPEPEIQDERDESSAYVKSWTTTLRRLPRKQQILAKKAIADVLFLAETGKLTSDSVQMSSSFRHYAPTAHPTISSSAGTLTPVCLYALAATPQCSQTTTNEPAARSTMRSPTQFSADENSEDLI